MYFLTLWNVRFFVVLCPLCGVLCEGCLRVWDRFVTSAYWEVFSSEGSCDFAVQSVGDERDVEI